MRATQAKPPVNEIDYDFKIENEQIQIGGNSAVSHAEFHYIGNDDSFTITADIVNDAGEVQTQLDQASGVLPPVLAVPFQKFTGGTLEADINEHNFLAQINEGVLTISGKLPSSGNWAMTQKRLDAALNSIYRAGYIAQPFYIETKGVNFVTVDTPTVTVTE